MAVDFFVNVFDGTHFAVFNTVDDGPVVEFCRFQTGTATLTEIIHVLFVDICIGVL